MWGEVLSKVKNHTDTSYILKFLVDPKKSVKLFKYYVAESEGQIITFKRT